MWILFAALVALAAVGLLLIKVKTAANRSGPVWQKVEPSPAPPARVIPISKPAAAVASSALTEKVMVAKNY